MVMYMLTFAMEQATTVQRGSRSTALLFFNLVVRWAGG